MTTNPPSQARKKQSWVLRYANRLCELTDTPIYTCIENAEKSWNGLSKTERAFVSPEACAEDDNQ